MTTATCQRLRRRVIGDIKGNFGSRRQIADMQTLAVEKFHPMMHIEQADFVTRHLIGFHAGDHGGIDTVARIANADAYPIAALVNADRHHAFAFTGLNTVNDGIFHQRLDKQARDHAADVVVNIVDDRQLVAESRLFNSDIIFDLIQLSFDINLLIVF